MANDYDVERGGDGRMLAEGWHGYGCDNCDCYHIELLDRQNKVFASLSINPEDLVDLAAALVTLARALLHPEERAQLDEISGGALERIIGKKLN